MDDAQRTRRLPVFLLSNTVHAIFDAFATGTTLVLFYDELGLDKAEIGILGSLMHLLGPIVIFIAPLAARFGLKRTVILFYGTRKVVIILLALAPWVVAQFGITFLFPFILVTYGLFRVIAETAMYPWMMDVIPNSIRGKYEAITAMATTTASLVAIAVASYVIETYSGLWRFQILIVVGGVVGVVSIALLIFLPAEEPLREQASRTPNWRELRRALEDRNLRAYLLGYATSILPGTAWAIFVPLYLVQEVGLAAGDVVMLQAAGIAGRFLSSFIWGLVWAAAIAFVAGLAMAAGSIGLTRLLYASIVPPEKRLEYMAVFYSVQEITLLLAPVLSGLLLTWLEATGTFVFGMMPYTFFFALTTAISVISLAVVQRIKDEGAVSTLESWMRLPGIYPALRQALRKQIARRAQR